MPHLHHRRGAEGRPLLAAVVCGALIFAPGGPFAAAAQAQDMTLQVPADSLVRVLSYDRESVTAEFSPGRFTLSGAFRYGCGDACEKPFRQGDMQLEFVPDPKVAARLPRWKGYTTSLAIEIDEGDAFAAKVIPPQVMQELLQGRRKWVTGRATIVVDGFHSGVDCDAAWYSARFVSLAEPPSLKPVQVAGGASCD